MKKLTLIFCLTIAGRLGGVGMSRSADPQKNQTALCKDFLKLENDLNKSLPKKIGSVTRLTALAVNCDTKTMKYTKQIMVDIKLFKPGWKERKQRQHNQLHCNKEGLAARVKWTAMDVIFDKDYNYVVTFITEPKDCLEKR